jgi:hypothetical protein
MMPHAVLMSASVEVSGGASRMMSSCVGFASSPFLANYIYILYIYIYIYVHIYMYIYIYIYIYIEGLASSPFVAN